jgi:hypothetical protein
MNPSLEYILAFSAGVVCAMVMVVLIFLTMWSRSD